MKTLYFILSIPNFIIILFFIFIIKILDLIIRILMYFTSIMITYTVKPFLNDQVVKNEN